jgi:hypothetical protein
MEGEQESTFGMRTWYRTCPCSYRPRTCNGAPLVVSARPSIAASLVGWSLLIVRAAQSPARNWIGAASAPIISGSTIAVRSYRVQRPRSRAAA